MRERVRDVEKSAGCCSLVEGMNLGRLRLKTERQDPCCG